MSDTHFQYVVSDDKTKLKIVLSEATLEYTADDVVKLALFFANLRAGMFPPLQERSQPDEATAEADRYEVYQKTEDGTAQIYLRIPGLCWTFIQLSKEQCLRMSETLNPPTSTPNNVTFN
jgi:hypothetical protein